MIEPWRDSTKQEWGNSLPFGRLPSSAIHAILHADAAKTLPPATRYDMRISGGAKEVLCWYRVETFDEAPSWGGDFGQKEWYYLVAQFVTPPERP